MPRGPRLDTKGALHHVMARGIEKRNIFISNIDREDLIQRFAAVAPKTEASIYAWSLMPNHFHLLVRTGNEPLSHFMRKILTGYAVAFNHRHKRSGHLFQNRYKSILVEEETYLLELVRYIHLNPVRQRLLENVDYLDHYPWTGHAVLMGQRIATWQNTSYILKLFSNTISKARSKYRAFVADALSEGKQSDLTGGGLIRSTEGCQLSQEIKRGREKWTSNERILGSRKFAQKFLDKIQRQKHKDQLPTEDYERTLNRLIDSTSMHLNLSAREIVGGSRRKKVVTSRKVISFLAVKIFGISPTKVAGVLNVSRQSVLRGLYDGEERIVNTGREILDIFEQRK